MTDTIRYQSTLESSRHDGDLETPLSDGKSTFGKLAFTEDIFDKDQHRALADIVKDMQKYDNRIATLERNKSNNNFIVYKEILTIH